MQKLRLKPQGGLSNQEHKTGLNSSLDANVAV